MEVRWGVDQDIVQAVLLVLSGTAVYLLASKNERRQFVGCLIGICGQPLWLWSAWIHGQWGIFILSVVFLYSYGRGAIARRPRKEKKFQILAGRCDNDLHPEHAGRSCQCAICTYCENPCYLCEGPVSGCEPLVVEEGKGHE